MPNVEAPVLGPSWSEAVIFFTDNPSVQMLTPEMQAWFLKWAKFFYTQGAKDYVVRAESIVARSLELIREKP